MKKTPIPVSFFVSAYVVFITVFQSFSFCFPINAALSLMTSAFNKTSKLICTFLFLPAGKPSAPVKKNTCLISFFFAFKIYNNLLKCAGCHILTSSLNNSL